MRYRPLLAGVAALALALSLTACGDDGDDESTDTTETESESEDTTAEETDDTASETTEAETTEAGGEAAAEVADLSGVLLTPADVGDTFVEMSYETSEEPGPCGAELDADHPYEAIVGTIIGEEERQLYLQHEIRTYADEATATETRTAAEEAFACGAETTQTGLSLGEVFDATDTVGGDAAFAVEVVDEENGQEGLIVVVQVGPTLSVYQFVGPTGAEDGPDAVAIVTDNVAAIEAALG